MKILLITAFYYPQNVIAVARVGQWAKYWAEAGHKVTVLTTKKYPFWPMDNQEMPNANIHIVEVDYLPNWLSNRLNLKSDNYAKSNEKPSKSVSILRFLQKKMRAYLGEFFDIHDFWPRKAIKTGRQILGKEKYDLIVSSYSPQSSHIIASRLKKEHPKIPWIADFRDLWADNHTVKNNLAISHLIQWKEQKTVASANSLITVSDPLSKILKAKYKNKLTITIENGFDPDEHNHWNKNIKPQRYQKEKIIINYTGIIYEGKRDPTPLFNVINKLIDKKKIKNNEISINFYGQNETQLIKIIQKNNSNKHKVIHINGQISRKESLRIQKESSILLLLEWNDKSANGVLTGKLFEYLVSGRPILAVGISTNNAAGQLILDTKTGICETQEAAIEKALLNYINGNSFENFDPDIQLIEQFSRKKQANKLLDTLNDI